VSWEITAGMAKEEATLILKLSSRPLRFQCSFCNGHSRGDFAADGWVVDLVEAFQDHVRECHQKAGTGYAANR
jgi:hypothetical protein